MKLKLSTVPSLFFAALLVGLVFSVLMRINLGFNSGHIDEYDYLFVGKRLLTGQSWNTYSYIFGSNLDWYLLGLGESLGGLYGARALAGLLGLVSLVGLYRFVRYLWDEVESQRLAVLSVVLFAMQASHIFISKLATYDIIALTFFSLSLAPLLQACREQGKARYWHLGLAIVLFSLAVTSKYIVIAYLPLVALIALCLAPAVGLIFSVVVCSILAVYAGWHWQDLQGLYAVQIKGVHGANASYLRIWHMEMLYLTLPLMAWVCAMLWRVMTLRRANIRLSSDYTVRLLWLLLVFAVPFAAYHLNGRNMISLYKHMVYALFFLSPVMAWLLWQFMQRFNFQWAAQAAAAAAVLGMVGLNYQHLRGMETAYPDVRPMVEAMSKLPLDANTTIASEDPYLWRYVLFGQLSQNHIKELGWMDNNMDGKFEQKDAIEAVWDTKFTYIFFNNLIHPGLNEQLRGLFASRGYEKVLEVPWQTTQVMSAQDHGVLELYKRTREPRIPTNEDAMFR